MRSARFVIAAALTSLTSLSPAPAHADCDPRAGISTCIDADNLWPHAGGGGFFTLGTTTTTPAGQLAFGLVGSYLKQPLGLSVASADGKGSTVFAVDDRFDVSLLFAAGITNRLELTLAAPATLYQNGAGLDGIVGGGGALPRSAVRDFRFGLSLAMLARPRVGVERGPALTGRFEVGVPLGSKTAFTSAPSAVFAPSLVFDWRLGRVLVAAEASARLRSAAPFANATVGTQIGGALGVSVDVLKERWLTVGAEAFALPTILGQRVDPRDTSGNAAKPLVPAEWIASISNTRLLGGDVVLSLGGGASLPFVANALTTPRYRLDFSIKYAPTGRDTDGDGVLDRDDKCPNEPEDRDGFEDADGCPDPDNDHDGIPDKLDKCPNEPEDKDGFEDADGCPDPDNDHDGIPDAQDQCPNEPEDRDGFQDADGCPDPDNDEDGVPDVQDKCPNDPETINGVEDWDGCPEPGARSLVRWDGDHVLVDAPVRFAPGNAAVPPALLRQVRMMAQLARGRAPLGSVILEAYPDRAGDTSVRGAELATARAAALKKVFVEAGIPADLISAVPGDPVAKRAASAPAFDVTVLRKSRRPGKSKQGTSNPHERP
jgi:hypothetical protein